MDTPNSFLSKSTIPIKEYSNKFLRDAKSKDSLTIPSSQASRYQCWKSKIQTKKKFYTCKTQPNQNDYQCFSGGTHQTYYHYIKDGRGRNASIAAHAKQSAKINKLLSMDDPQQLISLPAKSFNKLTPTTPLSKLNPPLLIPCKISTSRGLELFSKVYTRQKELCTSGNEKNKHQTVINHKKHQKISQNQNLQAKKMVLTQKDKKCNEQSPKDAQVHLQKHLKKFKGGFWKSKTHTDLKGQSENVAPRKKFSIAQDDNYQLRGWDA